VESSALDIRYNGFHREVHDLSGNSEVYHLLSKPGWIDRKACFWRSELLLILSERPGCQAEDVKIWYYQATKGDINEGCEEDGKIGGDEIQDEDFLDHCSFVAFGRFMIFEVVQSLGHTHQESRKCWNKGGKKCCGKEHLKKHQSKAYMNHRSGPTKTLFNGPL